jgi:hypothetical protein
MNGGICIWGLKTSQHTVSLSGLVKDGNLFGCACCPSQGRQPASLVEMFSVLSLLNVPVLQFLHPENFIYNKILFKLYR